MIKVLILTEVNNQKLQTVSFELLSRALALTDSDKIAALVISSALPEQEYARLGSAGAGHIIAYEAPWLEHFRPEPYNAVLLDAVKQLNPEIILGAATSTGRTLLPYSAMKMNTGLTADCTELSLEEGSGLLLQTRPAIGGNIMATIKTPDHRPQMATVRPRSTVPAPENQGYKWELVKAQLCESRQNSALTELSRKALQEKEDLSTAERVVVVGKGIKKAENIALAKELAEHLGAAIGATREVVDLGWLPYSCQIGLSGKTITPELYVGLGVSGAIQHLAGMQTAKKIVAINNDSDAQIFSIADLSIVGDLIEILPAINQNLSKGATL